MKQETKIRKRIIYILINCILVILTVISIMYIIDFFLLKKEANKESNLLNNIEINKNEIIQAEFNENSIEKIETERMIKLKTLQKENPDIIGWLEIENTNINYPVLQGTDNE